MDSSKLINPQGAGIGCTGLGLLGTIKVTGTGMMDLPSQLLFNTEKGTTRKRLKAPHSQQD